MLTTHIGTQCGAHLNQQFLPFKIFGAEQNGSTQEKSIMMTLKLTITLRLTKASFVTISEIFRFLMS